MNVSRPLIAPPVPSATESANRRERLAGALMAIGMCWPFMFSSVLPMVRWWMFLPAALAAGFMRQRYGARVTGAQSPLIIFVLVVLAYVLFGMARDPLPQYGREKFINFIMLGGAAYLAGMRQRPLTEAFARGLRDMLIPTLVLGAAVALLKREMFINAEQYGVAELRGAFSTVGFPLAIAMAGACLLPRVSSPRAILLAGLGLFGVASLEILIRGRFDAMLVCGLVVALLFFTSGLNTLTRLAMGIVLGIAAVLAYVYVLPTMGDSFHYLTWLDPSGGGRKSLFTEAFDGFWAHPFGQGFGAFARIEPGYRYPHNVILEVAYEMGIAGVVSMLAIYAFVFHRVIYCWQSPAYRIFAALLALLFLHILKACDIAMLAFHWVFLYMMLVATPISAGWPVRRIREAR